VEEQTAGGSLPAREDVVANLEAIRRLNWASPGPIARLGALYELLPADTRPGRNDSAAVAMTVQDMLVDVVEAMEKEERENPPTLDRSYAFAASLLLRLRNPGGVDSVADVFAEIAARWKVRKEKQLQEMSIDTFRVTHAPKVYAAIADRLLLEAATTQPATEPPDSGRHSGKEPATPLPRPWEQRFRNELRLPAFQRDGITQPIEQLASAETLTIFAGAGVSADIGLPLHEDLMPEVLKQIALDTFNRKPTVLPELDNLTADQRDDYLTSVIGAVHRDSSVYLASIAHELAAIGALNPAMAHEHANSQLVDAVQAANAQRKRGIAGGFLARGVAALAFALLSTKADRRVQVITTNYDSTFITEAQEKLHKYFPEFSNYTLAPIVWPTSTEAKAQGCSQAELLRASLEAAQTSETQVPVYYANGKLDAGDTIVAAELDFVDPADTSATEHERHRTREEIIGTALKETDCLFVGSSVTDPDMLARLAQHKESGKPRYALLLAPPPRNPVKDTARAEKEYSLARKFTEERFRHLGITPITLDFPLQVPQFLREVALRVQQVHRSEDYQAYGDRLAGWWSIWHKHLGFPDERTGEPGQRSTPIQLAWHDYLAELRDGRITEFLNQHAPNAKKERIMVEVWLRNPRRRNLMSPPPPRKVRSLFLWASSESMWLEGDTALWGPIAFMARKHYAAQQSFREGRMHYEPLESRRGHWKYFVSMPLVLQKAPWHHLPIGVVDVFSDAKLPLDATGRRIRNDEEEESQLACVTSGARADEIPPGENIHTIAELFEDRVKSSLNDIFGDREPAQRLTEMINVSVDKLLSEAHLLGVSGDGR
jgi:SIR2-like domain